MCVSQWLGEGGLLHKDSATRSRRIWHSHHLPIWVVSCIHVLGGVVGHEDAAAVHAIAAGKSTHHLQQHHISFGIIEDKLQACGTQKESNGI